MQSDIDAQSQSFFSITSIGQLVSGLVSAAIIVAALIALLFLILGGISWITSGGDKQKTESAQKTITNAVIGLVITVVAFAIWTVIKDFLGLGAIFN